MFDSENVETCKGCGNSVDLCICNELDFYVDDVEAANIEPDYYYPG